MGRTERSALRCVLVRTVIFVFLHAHVCTLVLVYSGDGVRKVWEASGCIGSDVIGDGYGVRYRCLLCVRVRTFVTPPLSSPYLNPPPTFCLTCSDGVLVGYSCGATAVLPSFWGGAHALTLAHGSHAKRCHFTLIDEHVRQA